MKSALRTAKQSGVPDKVRSDIANALRSAEGGSYSVEGAKSHLFDLGLATDNIHWGASEVEKDSTPGEWEFGSDVSAFANGADKEIHNASRHMRDAGNDANFAALAHQSVADKTESALDTVNDFLDEPLSPNPSGDNDVFLESPEAPEFTPSRGPSQALPSPVDPLAFYNRMLANQRQLAANLQAMQDMARQRGFLVPGPFGPW